MKTEASLLAEIAAAPTLREQSTLVAELDALRASKTARVQADRDLDLAGAVVQESLTPVLTHSFHTASTDWLSEADIPSVDANRVHAEASLWFGKTSSMVKADEEEFTEQASGVARRLASQFGEGAPEAQRLFMDYVAFLLRREAASGLPQIQQTHDGKDNPSTTPLPTETFDTFQDPIAPMNQGVDEMQSTENAPLLNEILQEASGEGQPEQANEHSTSQTFTGPTTNGSGMQVGASLIDAPSVAQGYLYNLDDFLRAEAAIKTQAGRESADDSESSPTTSSTDLSSQAGWREDVGINDEMAREGEEEREKEEKSEKAKSKKEAASGLDQVQQVVDSEENPKPTSMPLDVAFPLIPYFEDSTNKTLDAAKTSVKIASSVDEMLKAPQAGSDNPMLNKTHDGSEKKVAEPHNAMEQATKKATLDKTAAQDYAKGATFARTWTPGTPIVRVGSAAFEAGLYAGITANAIAQEAWLAEHERWGAQFPDIGSRIEMHAAFTQRIQAEAATTTDLEEMTSGNGLQDGPHGFNVPINGPGEVPPLAGGMDPAAPGGAAPYNGAEPFSKPVAPDPGWQNRQRQAAFQATVAARLAAQ